nr:hypothetical protein [Tanacetum cinerariifolium]
MNLEKKEMGHVRKKWEGMTSCKIVDEMCNSAIFTAVASLFFWQWQLSSLAVGTSSASGNSITGSGNALCILFLTSRAGHFSLLRMASFRTSGFSSRLCAMGNPLNIGRGLGSFKRHWLICIAYSQHVGCEGRFFRNNFPIPNCFKPWPYYVNGWWCNILTRVRE